MKNKLLFILILIAFLSFSKISLGQAPNLASSSNFAIFTSLGAINSVGATNIAGDVGTDGGAFTGFPPGIITGAINISNPVTVQAAIDVDVAYNYLVSLTCDSIISTTLGINQTLTPNVYCLGAASILTGNLILDGLGDPNALFIFKIDGALTTASFSNIDLINSAAACNVYWQINGLFDLGSNSIFKGTVIANGALNLFNASTLEGRGFSRAGAISLNSNTVSMVCAPIILPLELISFSSACKNQKVELKWSTATETNNDYFSIEHSKDGMSWEALGVLDGLGNSNRLANYSFTESQPITSMPYYRLKQIDFDKTYKYSDIILQENCKEASAVPFIYPNPSNGTFNLLFDENESEIISILICNAQGINIYSSSNNESTIDLSNQEAGIYFLHIHQASNVLVKKIVVNK